MTKAEERIFKDGIESYREDRKPEDLCPHQQGLHNSHRMLWMSGWYNQRIRVNLAAVFKRRKLVWPEG